MRSSNYTREVLAPVVAASRSLAQVMRKLGLKPTGGNYRYINARIRVVGVDTAHFDGGWSQHAWISDLSRDELEPLVKQSLSVAQVLVQLGLPEHGRPHRRLTRRLQELALDTSHFRGRGWSRGETLETHPTLERISRKMRIPDAEVFVENSRYTKGRMIARRMVAMGVAACCTTCGLVDWLDKPLVLHLDHINGINNDNRLENLRLLCPNCHSQTDTYCRRPSRASESCGVLYEASSRAWRNWLTHCV